MFHYMTMPLDQHSDGGLGAIGEAFEEAGDRLVESAQHQPINNGHLPAIFLFRHAIELFVKSMIVVLHRTLSLPDGDSDGTPIIQHENLRKRIDREHNLAALWSHLISCVLSNENQLNARCMTNWASLTDVSSAIEEIHNADPKGTYYRYPDLHAPETDRDKSSWKSVEGKPGVDGCRPVKAFMLSSADSADFRMFQYDATTSQQLLSLVSATAHQLSAAHSGLRVELAEGY